MHQLPRPRQTRRKMMLPLLMVWRRRRETALLLPMQPQPPAPRLTSPARQEMRLLRRRKVKGMWLPQRRRPVQLRQKVPLKLPLITRRPPRPKMALPRRSLNKPTCLLLSLMPLPPLLLQRMLPPRRPSLQRRLQKAAKPRKRKKL